MNGVWCAQTTVLGTFHVAALERAVVQTGLPNQSKTAFLAELAERFPGVSFAHAPHDGVLLQACRELVEYADGKRTDFTVPVRMAGTPFQQKVWTCLSNIPYGEAWTYRDVAEAIGQPGASRAVGQANNRNPLAPIVPCHRVVSSDGKLGGYGGGIELKQRMLEKEGLHFAQDD